MNSKSRLLIHKLNVQIYICKEPLCAIHIISVICCILHAIYPLYSLSSITNFKMWVDGSLNLRSVTILALISSTLSLKPLLINYEPLLSQAVL